ncbi:MAG TPA: MgtC/SapB family protein [Chloroflexota bacterium]|nr:MgtC/SapB family protein [Chloroflexota bacterium]
MEISAWVMILRLVLATLLGAAVGLERERLDRAAGLRTHALVAVSACLVMLVSAFGFSDALAAHPSVILDPSRVAAQVVSGIGFLGAGTIILRKNAVRGLTTAASVWAVAGLGLAVGGGMYVPAISATVLMLAVLVGLRPIEGRLFPHKRTHSLTVELRSGAGRIAAVESAVLASGLELQLLRLRPGGPGAGDRLDLQVGISNGTGLQPLLERLRTTTGVRAVTYDHRALPLFRTDENADDDGEAEDTPLPEQHEAILQRG